MKVKSESEVAQLCPTLCGRHHFLIRKRDSVIIGNKITLPLFQVSKFLPVEEKRLFFNAVSFLLSPL